MIDAVDQFTRIPWINEFRYDTLGTDQREFVEIAAPEDLDVTPFSLTLYNGYYGRQYVLNPVHPLADFRVGSTVNGVTFYYKIFKPVDCSGRRGGDNNNNDTSTTSSSCGLQNGYVLF